jgi:enamine deaminase RidA (YjgF/YER057c/UK114 family)
MLSRILMSALCMALPLGAQQKTKESKAESPVVHFVNPPGLEQTPRYTQVVEIPISGGRMLLISGQAALDKEGNVVGKGDMRAQTRQVFENLKAALAGLGATFDDVVKLNSFLVDMPANLPAYREVRTEYLAKNAHPPASTTVGVSSLVRPELLLEVEAVAVVQSKNK